MSGLTIIALGIIASIVIANILDFIKDIVVAKHVANNLQILEAIVESEINDEEEEVNK